MEDPRADVLLPRKRKSRVLPLFTLLSVTAAGGAGYYAWELREANAESERRAAGLEAENRSLSDALDLYRASQADLDVQLTTCREELDVEKTARTEVSTRLASVETSLTTCESSVQNLEKQRARARELMAEFQGMTKKFQKMIDTGQLEVELRRGQMVVKLPAQILFPSGSATLSEEGQAAIAEVARILKSVKNRRFTVAGHTDSIPIKGGEFKSNWELSTARAVTVTELLIQKGMRPQNLSAAGFGPYAPVATNKTEAGRRRNRRIEIILEPQLDPVALKTAASR